MNERFRPQLIEKRVQRLLNGTPTGRAEGMRTTWVDEDLTDSYTRQMQFSGHVIALLDIDVSVAVMHSSCACMFCGPIRRTELEFLCWRLVANTLHMEAGRVLKPWNGLVRTITAPLEIAHAKAGWSRAKKPVAGSVLDFRVIDGEACPFLFERWFPQKFLYVLAREMGVGNYRAANKYKGNRTELVGMRMVATLQQSEYDEDAITFERFSVGQFENHNRKLMAARAKPCPLGHKWPCHRCTLGRDQCPERVPVYRACRPVSLELRSCLRCNEQTQHDGGECVLCRRRSPSSRKQ